MTPPHPIDTDALRKLCEAAGWQEAGLHVYCSTENAALVDAARNAFPAILDELDRLRAAEVASKARVEELKHIRTGMIRTDDVVSEEKLRELFSIEDDDDLGDGPHAVCDGEWFAEGTDVRQWRFFLDPVRAEDLIANLRAERDSARAEIVRLTDAGAVDALMNHDGLIADWEKDFNKRLKTAPTPPPPAAADRGVPGQRVSDEDLDNFIVHGTVSHEAFVYDVARDLRDCRATINPTSKQQLHRRSKMHAKINMNNDQLAPESIEEAVRQRDGWYEAAAQFYCNEEYYRGLLDQIGEAIGEEALIADDGSKPGGILRAKLPALVRARLAA